MTIPNVKESQLSLMTALADHNTREVDIGQTELQEAIAELVKIEAFYRDQVAAQKKRIKQLEDRLERLEGPQNEAVIDINKAARK